MDRLFQLAGTEHVIVRQRIRQRGRVRISLQAAGERRVKRFVDQRTFSRAAHSRYQAQYAQWEFHGKVLQIVAAGPTQLHPALCGSAARSATAQRAPS
jgi:hypothetical protein